MGARLDVEQRRAGLRPTVATTLTRQQNATIYYAHASQLRSRLAWQRSRLVTALTPRNHVHACRLRSCLASQLPVRTVTTTGTLTSRTNSGREQHRKLYKGNVFWRIRPLNRPLAYTIAY